MVVTHFLIPVFSYTRQLQQCISNHGSDFKMLGSCMWQRSHLLLCQISHGAHFWQLTILYQGRGKPRQCVVVKKSWICYCQVPICTPEWEIRVVWWDRLFGRVGSTPQDCCLLRMLSERLFGSCTKSISFTNCNPWTIVLVKVWTYRMLPNYLIGKSRSRNVSPQAHFDMSQFLWNCGLANDDFDKRFWFVTGLAFVMKSWRKSPRDKPTILAGDLFDLQLDPNGAKELEKVLAKHYCQHVQLRCLTTSFCWITNQYTGSFFIVL